MTVKPVDPAINQRVALLRYEDSEFETGLQSILNRSFRHTAGINAMQPIEADLPFSVLVKNISTEPLRGLTVRFEVQNSRGKPRNFQSTKINLVSGTAPVLLPGSYDFFSPTHNSGSSLLGSREISVSIEVVVDMEGRFHGPDTMNVFDATVAQQQAESLLAERLAHKPVAEWKNELDPLVNKPSPSHFDRSKAFDHAMQRIARQLLTRVNFVGETAAQVFFEIQRWRILATKVEQ